MHFSDGNFYVNFPSKSNVWIANSSNLVNIAHKNIGT